MKKKLGFSMCGSFCTHEKALGVMRSLAEEYEVIPILSEISASTDTRFGTSVMLREKVTGICGREPVVSITEAEKFGPSYPLDYMIVCPCTGNTAAKIAAGITDSTVTMAVKAHLRCDRPLLITLATNDALSGNIVNIGKLMRRKNIWFVPMRQDDVNAKPYSLVADFSLCAECLELMKEGKQKRPIFI